MIYINGRFLLQNQTGVNRFAYEICKALTAIGADFILLCPHGIVKDCYDITSFNIKYIGGGKSHFWEQLVLPFKWWSIRGEKLLINFTGIGPIFIRNKITTIHDLAFMVNPQWYSRTYRFIYRLLTPLSAYTAKKVITVSEFSKREIVRLLHLKENKIAVIYNAVSSNLLPNKQHDTGNTRGNYILAVSSIDPRKNFQRLLVAFDSVNKSDVELYIIGGQNNIYTTSIDKLEKGLDNNRIKWLGRVSDEELQMYYHNAVCFVYPSLYEGFGIPPIEAMANGCPTIVSDIPPLKEVCGEAALYIDPNDENDISKKMSEIIGNSALQESLRQRGYERYKKFNWVDSARKIIELSRLN